MSCSRYAVVPGLIVLISVGPAALAFDDTSLSGCYVTSESGQMLGPKVSVGDNGALIADSKDLVLHGIAFVGRVCFDGQGNVTELNVTQNIAGLCPATQTGSGTYSIDPITGIGTAEATTTIAPGVASVPGCGLLGIQEGQSATFQFTFVVGGGTCIKSMTLSATTDAGPIPIVTSGEACVQTSPE